MLLLVFNRVVGHIIDYSSVSLAADKEEVERKRKKILPQIPQHFGGGAPMGGAGGGGSGFGSNGGKC